MKYGQFGSKFFGFVCIWIFLISDTYAGLTFSNKTSKFSLENGSSLGLQNPMQNWNGTLDIKSGGNVSGSVNFNDGYLNNQASKSELTALFNPGVAQQIQLTGNQILSVDKGAFINSINILGPGNTVQGMPQFSNTNAIMLENSRSSVTLALQNAVNSNIILSGGSVTLANDLRFTDDKNFTGSGTVFLKRNSLYMGGRTDLILTHTILWDNSTDINLTSKTSLSGTWNFTGNSSLNGNGNILDLTNGGSLYIKRNATLNLTDVTIKGLGIANGWLVFQDQTSQIRMSNVTVELDSNFTVSTGGIYIDGPTTFGLKNYNFLLSNNASMTVDSSTLWVDPLNQTNYGHIKFGSGSIGKYLSLTYNGTIKTQANLDILQTSTTSLQRQITNNSNAIIKLTVTQRTNSNAFAYGIKNNSNTLLALNRTTSNALLFGNRNNSNAIIKLSVTQRTNSNAFAYGIKNNSNTLLALNRANSNALLFGNRNNSNAIVNLYNNFLNYDVQVFNTQQVYNHSATIQNFAWYKAGFQVDPGVILALNTPIPVNGQISLGGTLTLSSDLFLESGATFTSSYGFGEILGNGNAIHLGGNLAIPSNNFMHIGANTIIEGHGNTLNLGANSEIFVDDNVTLTLRNVIVANTENFAGNPAINLSSNRSKLVLDNSVLDITGDFYLNHGQLFVNNDVKFTGTSAFVYRSPMASFIESGARLYFDKNTTFSVAPATFTDCPYTYHSTYTASNFIRMIDGTSTIIFDGASLLTTPTGLRLTTGKVLFDNQVALNSKASLGINTTTPATLLAQEGTGDDTVSVSWSPDGRFLAVCMRDTYTLEIFSVSGGVLAQNPIGTVSTGYQPQTVEWSPDGRFIAVSNINGISGIGSLQIFSFSGSGNPIQVTTGTGVATGAQTCSVSWSPDGRFIAVVNFHNSTLQVFSFNGSGNPVQVTTGTGVATGGQAYSVSWSPDGRFIAVVNFYGSTLQVFSFNGSGNPVQVTTGTGVATGDEPFSVTWSPDGRFIAVINLANATLQIFSFNGSGNPVQVTTGTGVATGVWPRAVAWSPDGRFIAIVNLTSGTLQIFSFYGYGNPTQVTTGIGIPFAQYPESVVWSPDGNFIAAVADDYLISIFGVNYVSDPTVQNISNSIVFGNSALGSSSDLNVKLLSAANVSVNGILNYDNTLGYTMFSSDNSRFVLANNSSEIRMTPNTVVGWRDRSLIKNITGGGLGDFNLQTYSSGNNIVTYAQSGGELVYDNSNSIISLNVTARTNSNAFACGIKNNSNAIVVNTQNIKNNSNAIIKLGVTERTNSNAFAYGIKNNSNAIISIGVAARTTSNALLLLNRTTSNALLALNRTTSNALLFGDRNNSNAIIKLGVTARTTSNAFLYGIKNNSNTLLALNRANSNALLALNRANSNALLAINALGRTTSNALLLLNRTTSNALLFGDRNSSNAIIKLGVTERTNSNAFAYGIKNNSNTLLVLNRTTSNALLFGDRNNSNAIIKLGVTERTNSNAFAYRIKNNSDTIVYLGSTGDPLMIKAISNAVVSWVKQTSNTANWLSTRVRTDSNALIYLNRTSSNAFAYGIKNNSNAIIKLNQSTEQLSVNTSNAIIKLGVTQRTNSNAFAYEIKNNSNVIVYLESTGDPIATKNSSNAIVALSRTERTNSNAFAYEIKNDSNAIVYLGSTGDPGMVKAISNAIVSWVKQTSNTANWLSRRVRTDSNALIYLNRTSSNAFAYGIKNNSNAIIYLGSTGDPAATRNNSNAIVALSRTERTNSNAFAYEIKNNSNAIIYLGSTGDPAMVKAISNAVVSWVKQTSEATNWLSTRVRTDSNALIYLNRTSSNAFAYGIRNNSNAIIKLNQATGQLAINNSNAIIKMTVTERTNSNAFAYEVKNNSNAIIKLSQTSVNNSNAISHQSSHFITSNNGSITIYGGITGSTTLVGGLGILSSPLNLQGGTLTMGGDLMFSNDSTIISSGNLNMQGNAIILGGDLSLPTNVAMTIVSSGVLDGRGNDLILSSGATLVVDNAVTLTLRNLNWLAAGSPQIVMRGSASKLTLQNVALCFDRNYSFTQGQLFIQNDVFVTGTNMFSYVSTSTSYIASHSSLYFDKNTTFSYSPNATSRHTQSQRNLIKMADQTSEIYFDECTLQLPDSGWQLTNGTIYFDNKVTVNGNTTQANSFEWGNGLASGDVNVQLLSSAWLDNFGYIYNHSSN